MKRLFCALLFVVFALPVIPVNAAMTSLRSIWQDLGCSACSGSGGGRGNCEQTVPV